MLPDCPDSRAAIAGTQLINNTLLPYPPNAGGLKKVLPQGYWVFIHTESIIADQVFFRGFHANSLTSDTTTYKSVSDIALMNGFELYSSLPYCPSNKFVDFV